MIDPILALALLLACEAQGHFIGDSRVYSGQPLSAQVGVMQVALHRQEESGGEWIHDILIDPGQFCLRKANLDSPILQPYKKIARAFLTNWHSEWRVPDLTGCHATGFTSNDKAPWKGAVLCRRLGDIRFWKQQEK